MHVVSRLRTQAVVLWALPLAVLAANVQELPPDARLPEGSGLRVIDGTIATGELLDWVTKDLKTKLLADKKIVGCFGLTPANAGPAFDTAAKSCRAKTLRETKPRVRPPEEMNQVTGVHARCLRDTMLRQRGIPEQTFFSCTQQKQ